MLLLDGFNYNTANRYRERVRIENEVFNAQNFSSNKRNIKSKFVFFLNENWSVAVF